MAGRGGAPTFAKRQRENAKREKKKRKQERREERRQDGGDDRPAPDGIDPDIAHIQPGPQPHPFLDDDELGDEGGGGG